VDDFEKEQAELKLCKGLLALTWPFLKLLGAMWAEMLATPPFDTQECKQSAYSLGVLLVQMDQILHLDDVLNQTLQ